MPKFADRVDDEFVHLVYQTSPLHDIGKVGRIVCPICWRFGPRRNK